MGLILAPWLRDSDLLISARAQHPLKYFRWVPASQPATTGDPSCGGVILKIGSALMNPLSRLFSRMLQQRSVLRCVAWSHATPRAFRVYALFRLGL